MDGYNVISQYDSYDRIISWEVKFDSQGNGTNKNIYYYNEDGSYTQIVNENGRKATYQYDAHGRRSDILEVDLHWQSRASVVAQALWQINKATNGHGECSFVVWTKISMK